MPSSAAARTAAPAFQLQFDIGRVPQLASHYDAAYDRALEAIVPDVQRQSLYTRDQLILACFWKSPRTKPRVAENEDDFVREVTGVALNAMDERIRIGTLLLLRGVSWPTASVLLHFGHRDRYPILDIRALEALGSKEPASGYSFEFWWAYVLECRRLADAAAVDMRTLDRALWQWSKQRNRTSIGA
jgi:hypothetical protein